MFSSLNQTITVSIRYIAPRYLKMNWIQKWNCGISAQRAENISSPSDRLSTNKKQFYFFEFWIPNNWMDILSLKWKKHFVQGPIQPTPWCKSFLGNSIFVQCTSIHTLICTTENHCAKNQQPTSIWRKGISIQSLENWIVENFWNFNSSCFFIKW